MPLPQDPYRRAAQEQAAAEAAVAKTAERQAKQAAREQKAAADAARKAELSRQELEMRAKGMIPVTTADGNLHPDPLFEQKQAEKAAKEKRDAEAAQLSDQFTREGRKFFTSKVTGLPVPLESDAQLEEQRKLRADKARRAALDERIQALETTATDPAQKRLPASAREKLTKQLAKTQQEALFGLQATLQEQAKATDKAGWWDVVNNKPTPEAQAAQERLARLSQPDAQLTEEDLAALESNDATKPQVQKLRNIQSLLAKDDEAAKFHEQTAGSIFDLKLRRDNPTAWAERQRQRRAGMTPEQLAADLESSSADLTARSQELDAALQPILTRRTATQQKLDDLRQQAAQRRQQGLTAGEMVTMTNPDGTTETWPADLAAQFEKEQALHQQAEAQDAPLLEKLAAQHDDLQAEAALLNEGSTRFNEVNKANQVQQAQSARRRFQFTPGMEQTGQALDALASEAQTRQQVLAEMHPDGIPQEALDALNADVQAKTEALITAGEAKLQGAAQAAAQIRKRLNTGEFGGKDASPAYAEAAAQLAEANGITTEEAKRLISDAESATDWTTTYGRHGEGDTPGQTRLLSNGGIVVNPSITAKDAYEKAVAASGATPEAQADAIARYPQVREAAAKQVLESIQEIGSVFGPGAIADYTAYAAKRPKDLSEAEWAMRYVEKEKAGARSDTWSTLKSITREAWTSLNQGAIDLRQQASGLLGGLTGSKTLMQDAQWASRKADALQQAKVLSGDQSTNVVASAAFSSIPRLAGSILPAAGGAKAIAGGVRLFAGTSLGSRLFPSLAAAIEGSTTPAQAAKAVDTLTRAGLGGASAAGAAQTYGAQIADIYGTLRRENPELSHADALQQAQAPAVVSALATAALTTLGGSSGVERLFTRPQEARAVFDKVFASRLQQAGFVGKEFLKGGLKESFLEELPDEMISQISAAVGTGKPVQQALAEFLQQLPELAIATTVMGGAGQGIEAARESSISPSPSLPVSQSSIPPEILASAEAAIDGLQIPEMDEATLARTQDAARGVLYIASGTQLTEMDADTLAALDIVEDPQKPGTFVNGRIVPGKNGVPELQTFDAGQAPVANPDGTAGMRPVRVRMVDGQPVISQSTLDKLSTLLPAVRAAIPLDEKQRLQQIQQPAKADTRPNPSSALPAQEDSVQTPAGTGVQPPRRGEDAANPPVNLSPDAETRATELATLLEERGLTAPQALAAARDVIKSQGVVGASAEEQYTAGIDKEMQAQGWVRGSGKKYTFIPPEGSPLHAKAPEAGQSVNPSQSKPSSEVSATPAPDPTDPFTPVSKSPAPQVSESSNQSDLADRVVVAKQRAMKAVPVASRKRFVKFVSPLTTHLSRFQKAFPGGIVFTDAKGKDDLSYTGAGIVVADASTNPRLEINLAELFSSADHLAEKDLAAFTRRAVMHEVRHLAALKVIKPSQARALWKDLTPALQQRIYASYYAADIQNATGGKPLSQKQLLALAKDKLSPSPSLPVSQSLPKADPFHMAHEFLRMLDEDAEFAGQTSEAMDASPALGQAILDFLRSVLDEIKRLIATDLDQSTRVQLREFQKLVEAARKQILADNPADRLGSTKEASAAPLTTAADNRVSVLGGQTSASAVAPRTDFNPVRGSTGTAYTDSNDPIEYQWAVADVNSLTISNLDNGRINPDYPQELQPRDRTSAASEAQVNDIAKNFNLDRLSASSSVGDGAPIVGPDTVVESGNGRVMGARRAHLSPSPHLKVSSSGYRKALIARAAEFGLNAEQVEAVPNPVLIRIRTTEVNRTAFVLAANVSTIAPKREMEQAKIDAKQIVPDLFDSFVPAEDGEIFTAANADFIRGFVSAVIPPAERGQVIDASGNLSQSGLRRIRNALFVHAYGTSPEALNALGRLTESIEASDTALARALLAMAPRFAEQNARIASGALYPFSITENLAQALQKLADLRARGEKVETWLAQDRIPGIGDDPGPVTTALVQFLHDNRQRPRQILDALDRYAKALDGAGDPRQISLFGDEKPDALTLWKLAASYKEPVLALGSKNPNRRLRNWQTTREAVLDALGNIEGQYIHRRAQAARSLEDAVYVITENLRTGGSYSPDGRSWEGTPKGLRVRMGESDAIVPWKQIATIARETSLDGQDTSPSLSLSESPPLAPQAALKLYRRLTAQQAEKPLTGPQSQALARAERSLGQLFLFDEPNKTLKPSEDLVLQSDPLPSALRSQPAEQLRLFMASKAITPPPETPEETAALDAVFAAAERAKPQLDALTRAIAEQFGANAKIPNKLKGRARSLDKMRADYAGDASKLKDLARTTIEAKDLAQAKAIAAEITRRTGQGPKRNLFEANPVDGYRDALFNVVIDGHTVEMQVHVPEILTTKHHLHHAYVVREETYRRAKTEARKPTAEEWKRIDRMNRIMRRAYNEALGLDPDLGATPEELARRGQAGSAGTSSSASSGFTRNPPLSLISSSEMGRGGSLSNAQPLPLESRTTANASARSDSSGTSMNPVAPGNVEGLVTSEDSTLPPGMQRITTENVQQMNPQVDASTLVGRQKDWRNTFTFPEGSRMLPLSKVIATKHEPQAVANAARFIGEALRAQRSPRKPVDASANPDGTFTLQDGNATAQALMLAGWKAVPGNLVEAPTLAMGRKSVRQSMDDWNGDPANGTTIASNYRGGNAWLSPDRRFFHNQEHHYMLPDGVDYTAAMKAGFIRLRPETTPSDGSKTLWVEFYPPLAAQTRALIEDQAAERGMDDVYFDPDRSQTLAKASTRINQEQGTRNEEPDLFSFNTGLGLDTLLTPRQKEAKVQQSQQLDLFGGTPNEKPQPASQRPARPVTSPRTQAPAQQPAVFGDLFAQPGMAGESGGVRGAARPPGLGAGPGTGGNDAAGGNVAGQSDAVPPQQSGNRLGDGVSGLTGSDPVADTPRRLDRPSLDSPARNFAPPADLTQLAPAGAKAKIRANLAAIKLLKELEAAGRDASPEEKRTLAAYSGWGAFKEAFNDSFESNREFYRKNPHYVTSYNEVAQRWKSWEDNWGELHDILKKELTEDEYRAASRSTLNAHYTAAPVIRAMWQMIERLGFKGGRALEPSAGAGHYIGLQPAGDIADRTQWQTVELDELTARLLAKLYPEATVNERLGGNPSRQIEGLGFERARIPNGSLDLIISNVPFHESGPRKKGFPNLNLHNFFFAHALDKVKPGGLVAFITSSSTMQNNQKQRDFIASKGDLVAAFRLPNNAFKENAGTEVVTDILILRKPDGTSFKGEPWRSLAEVGRQTITLTQGKEQTVDELRREARTNGEVLREYDKNGVKAIDVNAPILVNEYFANHPEHVLGTHSLQGSMYRGNEYTVTAPSGFDVGETLSRLASTLPENVMGTQEAAAGDRALAGFNDRPFSFKEQDGKVYEVQDDGSMIEADWSTNPAMVKTFRSWLRVKDAIRTLIEAESDPSTTDASLVPLRRALNIAYDTHIATHGYISRRFGNKHTHLYSDPEYPLTAALENEKITTDAKTGKRTYSYPKATIMQKRVMKPIAEPTTASDIQDAVEKSLAWRGMISPPYMASLLGLDLDAVNARLDAIPDVFEDPGTSTYEHAETYLTGNIRTKLDAAEEAAQDNPKFQKNVSALSAVMPEHRTIAAADPSLGERWIPGPVYDAFIREILGGSDKAEYIAAGNMWRLDGTHLYRNADFDTDRMGSYEILDHALSLKEPMIYDRTKDATIFNATATAAAKTSLTKMRRAFNEFVKTSETPVEIENADGEKVTVPVWKAAEDTYNETMNNFVTPKQKGDYLQFPGLSEDVWRTAHRRAVIARFLAERRGMMAHGVGSGKTFNQIILSKELRRLGLAKKPLIVVQNSTLGQFAASYMQAYPSARILVPTERDLQTQNRRKLVSKIATGSYDAVILSHSQFDLISNKPESVKAYMGEKIDELKSLILRAKGGDKSKVRDLEGMLKRLEDRLANMLDALKGRQDSTIYFEDLGVDALIVDEAHNYKSIPIVTRMGRVKGVPSGADSQRAIGMLLKARHVQAKTGGKNVFLATGTPVKNSMAEAYIMMDLMAPDVLAEYKIYNFDDFATAYGEIVSSTEISWSGAPKVESRFAKFKKGRELITMIRSVFDVAMGNDKLGLKVPKIKGGAPSLDIVPVTPTIERFNTWVRSVADAWANADGKKKEEFTAVPIMTLQAGIVAALDPRLLAPGAPDHAGSKVNTAVRDMLRLYHEGTAKKTTQLVFADLRRPFNMEYLSNFAGHPFPEYSTGGDFDLYEDIKAKLIAGGVPEKEILLMDPSMSKAKRTAMFEKVSNGEIRIAIGSTETLGVGVNVQERLKALHHLMPPRDFTPAMHEQRNGRAIRQGNLHYEWGEEIEVHQWGTEGSMDSAVYGTLGRKQRFITQLLMGEIGNDSFDDPTDPIAVNLAEMAARTMGDPDFIRRIEIEKELRDLRLEADAFTSELSSRRSRLATAEHNTTFYPRIVEAAREKLAKLSNLWTRNAARPEGVKETTDISDKPVYEFGGKVIDTAAKDGGITTPLDLWLAEESIAMERQGKKQSVGLPFLVNGIPFTVQVETTMPGSKTPGTLNFEGQKIGSPFSGADGLIRVLRGIVPDLQKNIETYTRYTADATATAARLRELLERDTVFPRRAELDALEAELQAVDARLAAKASPPPQSSSTSGRPDVTLPPLTPVDPKLMTPAVRGVLENAWRIGSKLFLPDNLERKLYEQVNKALESVGGQWNRKAQAHLFSGDPSPYLGVEIEDRSHTPTLAKSTVVPAYQFTPAVRIDGRVETANAHFQAWINHALRQIPAYKKDGLDGGQLRELADAWLVKHPDYMAGSTDKEGFVTPDGEFLDRQTAFRRFQELGGIPNLSPGEERDWLDISDLDLPANRLAKASTQVYTPSSYDTAAPDPFTGIPSLITGQRLTREQGRAIGHAHAKRLRAGLPNSPDRGNASPALAASRAGTLNVSDAGTPARTLPTIPVLSAAQFARLQKLPLIGEGAEAKVYADRTHGTVYKVLQGYAPVPGVIGSSALGVWPQVYYTSNGQLDYAFAPADRPRQLVVRLAVQTLVGGTPTEIVGIGPEGHLILKQPLSPAPEIGRDDNFIDNSGLSIARHRAGLVEIPKALLADPQSPRVFLAVVEGRPWLLMDLHPDNFVGDNQAQGRINDAIVGQLPASIIAKVPGLAQLVRDAAQRAQSLGDRSDRLFMATKRVDGGADTPVRIRRIGEKVAEALEARKKARIADSTFEFYFQPSDDPEHEGDGTYEATWTAPSYEDQYLERFVPLPSIYPLKEGGFYVGDSPHKYATLDEAKASVKQGVADYLEENTGSFGANMDGKESAGAVFDQASPYFAEFGSDWFGSKWGSWYYEAKDSEGEKLKISIRDHEATRADLGLPDKAWGVSKNWDPVQVAEALAKAWTWLKANAESLSGSGAAGIKANLESADAPTRAGDVRVTDRATEATSDSSAGIAQLAKSSTSPSLPVSQSPSPLAKLGWNHLDRHVSAKLAALARWTDGRTGASQTVAKWTGAAPQKLREAAHALQREFFPDSVLPREILAKKREMEIKTAMGSQRSMDLVRALSSNPKFSDIAYPPGFAENPLHRRHLYEAMTGERDLATLPKPLQSLAARLRAILIETGREAVKQGRMSTETFDNLRSTYMPHFYEEDVQKEKSLFQRFRLGVRDILAQRTTAWHIEDTSQKDSTGQFRLVSHSGNQWRFRNKEHMDAFFEDFIQQQALGELQSRYGKKYRSLTAADLMTPSKLDPEVRGRLQEIKRTLHQRYKRQRPLTIAEQEKAGLIMDPVYAIARYTAQMAHDNSTAEFFNFVASQPALVSDIATPGFTEIPDNPRFGRLAGKFVQDDVAGQLLELIEAPGIALKIYDTVLGWWKTGKTVLNPGTHVRNVLGNLFFSQLAGNSVWNPGNATYYRQAIAALRQGGPVLTEAYDAGVLGADFVSAELRQTLRQLLPDPATISQSPDSQSPRLILGIGKAIGRFIGTPAGKAYNNIAALYQAEDEVFKLAAFLKAKAMLPDTKAAAEHVRHWFPYFDSGTSGTLRLLGRTAMPFLGFYRESIRIFGHALKERPIALAAGLSVPSIITALSAMALGLDDDDLEEIEKDMRGKAGKLLGPTPLEGMPLFSMLLPFRSESGQVQQFDISAVHPFVDFLGTRVESGPQEDWWQKTLRSFIAAGPIGSLLYSQMTGRDAFGDRTFVEDNMTGGEKLAARLDNAAKTLLPPLVPGGTGFKTLADAGDRTTNKTLETRSPAQAILRTVGGLDVRNATPDLYRLAEDWRKAHGYEVTEGMDYGSTTPASRARKALFAQLAQDQPNLTAIGNILKSLDKMGHPVRTEQDVNKLLFYRDPMKLIGGNKAKGITPQDAQAQFRASLQGEASQALENALQEFQRIKQRAPSLIRRAATSS